MKFIKTKQIALICSAISLVSFQQSSIASGLHPTVTATNARARKVAAPAPQAGAAKKQALPDVAKNCRIVRDKRNNTIIYVKRTSFVMPKKVATIPPQPKQESSGIGCYYQHDTTGYGGELVDTNACLEVNVQDVDGDGFIVSASDATVCHVVIANVTGTGLIIKGSHNVLHDVVLVNCKVPFRIDGSGNTLICTVLNIAKTDVNALTPPKEQNDEGTVDSSTTRVDGQIIRR